MTAKSTKLKKTVNHLIYAILDQTSMKLYTSRLQRKIECGEGFMKKLKKLPKKIAEALKEAELELVQMHTKLHPECEDLGPDTCPTWHAIYAVRRILNEK